MTKKAVVLLSGGLDSSTCLALAKERGYEIYALTVLYGQRHSREVQAAIRIAQHFGVKEHKIITLDMRVIGGSALTDNMDVPESHPRKESENDSEVPITYVPMRNAVFLSIAASWAEVCGAHAIYTGVNAVDYSNYPDCTQTFVETMETALNNGGALWKKERLSLESPLLHMTKGEIVREGERLFVPWSATWSCYNGREFACGKCESCKFRLKGFEEAGVVDPVPYS